MREKRKRRKGRALRLGVGGFFGVGCSKEERIFVPGGLYYLSTWSEFY